MPKRTLKDYINDESNTSQAINKFESLVEGIAEKITTEYVEQAKEDLEDQIDDFKSDLLKNVKKGDQGDRGLKGEEGKRGEHGEQGLQGIQGLLGKDGKDGHDGKDGEDAKVDLDELKDELKKEVINKIPWHGGGNANRQINVNSSVMSTRYTDINFQQFGNIGWSAVNDNDYKRVNIRASLLAGGGGGGITRSVSVLSVSSTLAATALTDYVAFANVGVVLTLPTAISNTNLYTVKNMTTSSVQVAAATGQDIDGSATVLMPTQYESLTFISNSSVWGVI